MAMNRSRSHSAKICSRASKKWAQNLPISTKGAVEELVSYAQHGQMCAHSDGHQSLDRSVYGTKFKVAYIDSVLTGQLSELQIVDYNDNVVAKTKIDYYGNLKQTLNGALFVTICDYMNYEGDLLFSPMT